MIQIKVSSGNMAGHQTVVRRFPFHIGRDPAADLRLDGAGVWDRHARLDFKPAQGFFLTALGDALIAVNGQVVHEAMLRNGDSLSVGSAELQFWLAETRQRSLRIREAVFWACVTGVTLGQVALLYWLLQ